MKKHPHKAMQLFKSFMREEFKLAMNLLFEAWDFFTDSYILFTNVLFAEEPCASRVTDLVVPWLACYAIASIASLVSIFLKAKVFREQMYHRRSEFVLDEEESTDSAVVALNAKLKKHAKRFVKTKRKIQLTYSSMLIGIAECAPLGVLQILFALRCGGSDTMSQLSLVTTWLMLGMKIVKSTELETMWRYRKKQKQKVVLLTSLVAAARSAPDAFTSETLTSKRDTHEAKAAGPISTRRNHPASIEMTPRNLTHQKIGAKRGQTKSGKSWAGLFSVDMEPGAN